MVAWPDGAGLHWMAGEVTKEKGFLETILFHFGKRFG
jgi:hypothetical protein